MSLRQQDLHQCMPRKTDWITWNMVVLPSSLGLELHSLRSVLYWALKCWNMFAVTLFLRAHRASLQRFTAQALNHQLQLSSEFKAYLGFLAMFSITVTITGDINICLDRAHLMRTPRDSIAFSRLLTWHSLYHCLPTNLTAYWMSSSPNEAVYLMTSMLSTLVYPTTCLSHSQVTLSPVPKYTTVSRCLWKHLNIDDFC